MIVTIIAVVIGVVIALAFFDLILVALVWLVLGSLALAAFAALGFGMYFLLGERTEAVVALLVAVVGLAVWQLVEESGDAGAGPKS